MKRAKTALFSIAVIALLIGLQALFVASYVDHEREIYAWDHIMYFNMVRQDMRLLATHFSEGWDSFKASFTGNYNHVFALPSFLTFRFFGDTRRVFILTNFCVFFLAYEAGFAFLLHRLFAFTWPKALVLSLIAAALVPPLWLSLLEGYPDIGAAACILFAFTIAFEAIEKPQSWRRALLLGLLLTSAILLRRHFAYPALALLVTTGLFMLEKAWHSRALNERMRIIGLMALFFALCGAVIFGLIELIAPDFLRSALTTNYSELYVAYKRPVPFFLHFVASIFGIGLLLLGAMGLLFLDQKKERGRKLALFVAFFTILCLTIWCLGPSEAAHHYMLHVLPLAVLIGFSGWFFYLTKNPSPKKIALGVLLLLFLIVNAARALWFSSVTMWPQDEYPVSIFSAPRPPIVRPDYDEWLRLARYLRQTTGPQDHIEVIGASIAFSLGVLFGVYEDILNATEMYPRLMEGPEIDHISPPPLNVFSVSDVYVVATPTQYHLDPSSQKVVTAAADQFPPPPSRASFFKLDPEIFHMADGITVRVWRRTRDWPPEQLHEALSDIRRIAKADERFNLDWVTLEMPLSTEAATDHNRTVTNTIFGQDQSLLGLFFDYPLGPGSYELNFSIDGNYFCPNPQYKLTVMKGDGQVVSASDFLPVESTGETSHSFELASLSDQKNDAYFLKLEIRPQYRTLCQLNLNGLRVEKTP